ncbi:MAG: polyprenyl synthetase family protein [Chlorobi bacterium]|nr:polyprenyl synthetase family protein [Chlorobiota bacterium]
MTETDQITLADITRPVDRQLKEFRKFFRNSLRSNNLLLDTAIRYILKKKGKQVRPILVLLSAAAAGSVSRRSFIGATMVELLHTATLVHDDVVDEADERRGSPSVNSIWNNKTAVLVGDYMLAQGLRIANENNEFGFLDITSQTVQRMSQGELMQTRKTQRLNIQEEEYFRIISDKTASLISACCEIGALSAADDPKVHRSLRRYGELVGMAFQIRDDIFDFTSQGDDIGKPIGNDLKEQKLTLPLIRALSLSSRRDAKRVTRMIRNGDSHKPEMAFTVRHFVVEHDGIAYAEETAERYRDQAREALSILPQSPAREALHDFAEYVITRQE